MKKILFLFLFLIVAIVSASAQDKIKIASVTTSAPLKDGVANEFTVNLEYSLKSADEAMIGIGFNSEKPNAYRMTAQKRIAKGVGVMTLKADVTPKNWKEKGDFIVYANLSPYPMQTGRFTPLATTTKVASFVP